MASKTRGWKAASMGGDRKPKGKRLVDTGSRSKSKPLVIIEGNVPSTYRASTQESSSKKASTAGVATSEYREYSRKQRIAAIVGVANLTD